MMNVECPGCGGDAGDNWFDRSLCACDKMHTRCRNCGHALDGCQYDDVTGPSNPGVYEPGLTRREIWLPVIVGLAILLTLALWEVLR